MEWTGLGGTFGAEWWGCRIVRVGLGWMIKSGGCASGFEGEGGFRSFIMSTVWDMAGTVGG